MNESVGEQSKPAEEEVWTTIDPVEHQRARMIEQLRVEKKSRANSCEQLKADLFALVSFRYDLLGTPYGARMNELNRRFGMQAKEFGCTCRDLIEELAIAGKIELRKHNDSFVILDAGKNRTYLAQFPDTMMQAEMERLIVERTGAGQ